jgi:2-hydroxychromene-2-carboxylate isomerase
MKHIDFYLDFISPYAHLAFEHLPEALEGLSVSVAYKPVLLGALLKHHGQLGPAEIPSKRSWTYRHVLWLGQAHGIPIEMPASHPYNPLPHLRLAVATSDDGSISRLAAVQEHRMILKAIEDGASEQRIARALNIDIQTLRAKKRMLAGVCPEAVDLLKERPIAEGLFRVLKRMQPLRQIEAVELMIAMDRFTITYAEALLAATPQNQLAADEQPKQVRGLTPEQMALMERESSQLERELRVAERTYGPDHMHLVVARGYLGRLLGNARVVRYLAQQHPEFLAEFQRIIEGDTAAA